MNSQTSIDISLNISNLEFKSDFNITLEEFRETIHFCVVASIYSDSNHTILMHVRKIIFRIETNSSISINTAQTKAINGGDTCIDHEEPISVFQCDDNYTEFNPPPILSQGDTLQVCLQVTSHESIFEFDYINELNIIQADNIGSPVNVITNRTKFPFEPLTSGTTCSDGVHPICKMKFQMLGSFFAQASPPSIHVSGNAELALKSVQRPTGIFMSFIETVYCINDDMTTDFNSTIIDITRTAPIHIEKHLKYEEQISVFQCDDSFVKFDDPPILHQGDAVQVCMQVDNSGGAFQVDYIKELNITQTGNLQSPLNLITNRTDFLYESLTKTQCNADDSNQVCKMKFQLTASFFEQADLQHIGLTGRVKLALKNTGN